MPSLPRLVRMAAVITGAWMLIGGLTMLSVEARVQIWGAPREQFAPETFIVMFAWALLTPFALFLAERLAPVVATILVAVAGMAVTMAGAWAAGGMQLEPRPVLVLACEILGANVIFAAFIAGVAVYARVQRQSLERQARAERLEAQLADARLRRLRADLQPHFLFNTLNAVAALVHVDADAAGASIRKLIDLLRHSTDTAQRAVVPLREEIEFAQRYLDLHRLRFGDRMHTSFDVAEAHLLDVAVPPLILQPILENAITHGLRRRHGEGSIRVRVRESSDRCMSIEVQDDGPGCDPRKVVREDGIGIPHTRARLEAMYQRRDVLRFRAERDAFVTEIRVPLEAR